MIFKNDKRGALFGSFLVFFFIGAFSCQRDKLDFLVDQKTWEQADWKSKKIEPSSQIWDGDSSLGEAYIWSGRYVGSGMPFDKLKGIFGRTSLPPEVESRKIDDYYALPKSFNVYLDNNGVRLLSGTCFTCHAGKVNQKYIVGLGNIREDFSKNLVLQSKLTNVLVRSKTKKGDHFREAFGDFGNYFRAMAPKIQVNQKGMNPAFRLAEACVSHRDPVTLAYQKKKRFEMTRFTVATDIPPLWNVKKKNALYYNAMGRGDFTKLLMQSTLLGVKDSTQARAIQKEFVNVMAWLQNLKAPKYPFDIDEGKTKKGKKIFEKNCADCHGTYHETDDKKDEYPNQLINLKVIKTDPLYAYYVKQEAGFADWYNESWFAKSEPKSACIPEMGYIAPPLDGIWATAPYFHNGSVPSILGVLNSSKRPETWYYTQSYDKQYLGLSQNISEEKSKLTVYNTVKQGQSNKGHYFGDHLEEEERYLLIEYLKTL